MNRRKAHMMDSARPEPEKRAWFHAVARSYRLSKPLFTQTRGRQPRVSWLRLYSGDIEGRRNGALIASETGTAVAYAIFNLQDRGTMFIDPQTPVYQGMIVGEHSRDNDLEINVLKGKKLTNARLGR